MRDEPLAIELHNTLYADAGQIVDALADERTAAAWLVAVRDRLPAGQGAGPTARQLHALRVAVRDALAKAASGGTPTASTLDVINAHSSRAPHAVHARWRRGALPALHTDYGKASRRDIVLASIAADAVDLLTGPHARDIRRCGAPGCVLAFVKDHPRQEWCSAACGNRARQARHYRRHRARSRAG